MKIKDIQDAMNEVKEKTGRFCTFKISTKDNCKVFETYISTGYKNIDHQPYSYHLSSEESLSRFKTFILDSQHDIAADLKAEKKRLTGLINAIDIKLYRAGKQP